MAEPMQSIITVENFIVTVGDEDRYKALNSIKTIKAKVIAFDLMSLEYEH